ncbi:hypothetical protein B9Z55_004265 [Caenorhabditis nigoni]|uniref:Uncharacterized protein n=2 Tax=Caenorhabditis nigoni TaxID=1611254 RepID=A0A2G5UVP1_9PELO|nr:hypothetical protein B9Z55_004265 [Caenorhabditis nigoni]
MSQEMQLMFPIWLVLLSAFLVFCVSKKSQKSGNSSTREVSERRVKGATANSQASEKSEKGLSSEKSVKSTKSTKKEKNMTIDSLKVPRPSRQSTNTDSKSQKSSKEKSTEAGSSKGTIPSETDSAKTELIEVPLGKAAREDASNNILTPLHEQKASSFTFQAQKVSFAHSLKRVRRRGTRPADDPEEKTAYIPY